MPTDQVSSISGILINPLLSTQIKMLFMKNIADCARSKSKKLFTLSKNVKYNLLDLIIIGKKFVFCKQICSKIA